MKVTIRDGTASFAGQGIGHGVGLCQYGAETLARATLQKKAPAWGRLDGGESQ